MDPYQVLMDHHTGVSLGLGVGDDFFGVAALPVVYRALPGGDRSLTQSQPYQRVCTETQILFKHVGKRL